MNTHTNDNSSAAELDKCITWQYDKATNLVAFIGMLGDFFAQATQGLWDSWKNKVCDIDTADDFGLSVWGKILNCPRPMLMDEELVEILKIKPTPYFRNEKVGNKIIQRVLKIRKDQFNRIVSYDDNRVFVGAGDPRDYIEMPVSCRKGVSDDEKDAATLYVNNETIEPIFFPVSKWPDDFSVYPQFTAARSSWNPNDDYAAYSFAHIRMNGKTGSELADFLNDPSTDFYISIACADNEIDITGHFLSTEKYRSILKARAQLLASHGTVEDYKQYVQTAFSGHFTVIDDNGMGICFEATSDATDEELALAEQFPDVAFLYPCGVRNSDKIADGEFSLVDSDEVPALDNTHLNGEIEPLRFTSEQDGSTILLTRDSSAPTVSLECSINGGLWRDYAYDASIALNKDEYVEFRAKTTNTTFSTANGRSHIFITNGLIAASGNIMSLLSKDGSIGLNAPCCLAYIFGNGFDDTDGLTEPPELPAIELCENCYEGMFTDNHNLRHAPKLPATNIPHEAYGLMFSGCSMITETPDLTHITSAGESAFRAMFYNCTSLKDVIFAPLDVVAEGVYKTMFRNCTAIEELAFDTFPAETLSPECYANMFMGCTNLKGRFKILGTELVPGYIEQIGTGTQTHRGCFNEMFKNCPLIDRIEVNFTEWKDGDSDLSATKDWVSGVASTGEFICPPELPISFGNSRVHTGWRIVGGSNIHNVTIDYYNGDQRVVEVQQVFHGGNARVPVNFSRNGFFFDKWDGEFNSITSDSYITALYGTVDNPMDAVVIRPTDGAKGFTLLINDNPSDIYLEYQQQGSTLWIPYDRGAIPYAHDEYIVLRAVYGRQNLFAQQGGYYQFCSYSENGGLRDGKIEIYGNLTSLTDGTNRSNGTILGSIGSDSYLFRDPSVSRIPDVIVSHISDDALCGICRGNTSLAKPCKIKVGKIEGSYSQPKSFKEMFKGCTGIVLNNEQGGTPWRIELDDTSGLGDDTFKDMFSGTSGTMNGTPQPNTTYYFNS